MKRPALLTVVGLTLAALLIAHVPAVWARAGGGGSVGGGGRGSRSYSAPARPAPSTPTSPSRSVTSPSSAPSPAAPSRPSFFSGLMGGLAGFALGGLLGSMLFGHGFGSGFGFGLLELLLIGGAVFLVFAYLRRRREAEAPAYGQRPAYATVGGPAGYDAAPASATVTPAGTSTSTVTTEPPPSTADLERGLGHIRQMDGSFDPASVVAWARGTYLDVQTALKSRQLSSLRDRLAPEIYAELQAQCDHLRSARQTNVVERIDIRRADITEAWQETGRDYLTIYFASSMLDYTIDDATGAVAAGSKSTPQDVEEFWTFTRPVGRHPWQLSAIQAA